LYEILHDCKDLHPDFEKVIHVIGFEI
jgi:hypothetical protein